MYLLLWRNKLFLEKQFLDPPAGFLAELSGICARWGIKVNDRFEAECTPPDLAGLPSGGRRILDKRSIAQDLWVWFKQLLDIFSLSECQCVFTPWIVFSTRTRSEEPMFSPFVNSFWLKRFLNIIYSSISFILFALLSYQKFDDRPLFKPEEFCLIWFKWFQNKYFCVMKIIFTINQFQHKWTLHLYKMILKKKKIFSKNSPNLLNEYNVCSLVFLVAYQPSRFF